MKTAKEWEENIQGTLSMWMNDGRDKREHIIQQAMDETAVEALEWARANHRRMGESSGCHSSDHEGQWCDEEDSIRAKIERRKEDKHE